MGIVVNLVAQGILFVIELASLLLGQRSTIGTYLFPLLELQSPLLRFELLRFLGTDTAVANTVGNPLLLAPFSVIDFRSARMMLGKPVR